MLAMLRAGRVGDAYRVAHRRLVASGLRPLSEAPGIRDRSDQGRRLAAALLFPLDQRHYKALCGACAPQAGESRNNRVGDPNHRRIRHGNRLQTAGRQPPGS